MVSALSSSSSTVENCKILESIQVKILIYCCNTAQETDEVMQQNKLTIDRRMLKPPLPLLLMLLVYT